MRLIKMLGLAAVAALAAMAFVGAGTASATYNTCITETDTIGLEECANQPAEVHFVDPVFAILTTAPKLTIKCEALFVGTNLGLASAPNRLQIHVAASGLTFANCNNKCKYTTTEGGIVLLLKTDVELGEVTKDGFKIHVICGEAIDCEYNSAGLVGHFLGGLLALPAPALPLAHITYSEAAVTAIAGGLCPTTAKLDALFVSLVDLYLRG